MMKDGKGLLAHALRGGSEMFSQPRHQNCSHLQDYPGELDLGKLARTWECNAVLMGAMRCVLNDGWWPGWGKAHYGLEPKGRVVS